VGFAVDLVVSLKTVIGISKNLGELERIARGLHQLGDEMSTLVGTAVIDTTEKLSEEREELSQKTAELAEKNREERAQRRAELQEKITQLEERSLTLQKRISGNRRILRAFPKLRRSSSRISLTEELLKLRERHKKEDNGEKHAEIL
jgi:seryl-tRNA synthetase